MALWDSRGGRGFHHKHKPLALWNMCASRPQALSAVEDFVDSYIQPTLRLAEEEKKAKREEMAATKLPWFLDRITR